MSRFLGATIYILVASLIIVTAYCHQHIAVFQSERPCLSPAAKKSSATVCHQTVDTRARHCNEPQAFM